MNDQVVHAPLSTLRVQKALDIGCGTGTVTDRIASQFPDAQVYGLDLSPVPNIREKLQNIEYVQADFNEVTGPTEPDARFKKGSFDYIFSRLLVLGMTDWKGYIGRCIGLAKPGVCTIRIGNYYALTDITTRAGSKCTT
jgi:ubiquinone/menaquinone biosynthesis C-methylase UbiE